MAHFCPVNKNTLCCFPVNVKPCNMCISAVPCLFIHIHFISQVAGVVGCSRWHSVLTQSGSSTQGHQTKECAGR